MIYNHEYGALASSHTNTQYTMLFIRIKGLHQLNGTTQVGSFEKGYKRFLLLHFFFSILGHLYGDRVEKSKLVLKIFIMLFHVYIDLESINMSGTSSSISSQTLGAGIFGGVVVGLLIGAVISCVTTKIVWGAPNMTRCQKRSEQSKLKFVKICDYTCIPDTEFSN